MHKWSLERIKKQTVGAYVSPDGNLASHAFHVPEELVARSEVGEREGHDYFVHHFGFEHDDRVDLFLESNPEVLLRERVPAHTLDEAEAAMADWVGPTRLPCSFEQLPGVYQWALLELIWGEQLEVTPMTLTWVLPPGHPGEGGIDQFPPRVQGEESED